MQLGEFLDEWDSGRASFGVLQGAAYLVCATALVWLAPFGGAGDHWIVRLLYWLVMMGLLGAAMRRAVQLLPKRLDWLRSLPLPTGICLALVLFAAPMTLAVLSFEIASYFLVKALRPSIVESLGLVLTDLPSGPVWRSVLVMYANVLAVCVLVAGPLFLSGGGTSALSAPMRSSLKPGLRFFSRLPSELGSNLCYLQMQDHYLHVVTRQGNATILMSMRDATAELEGVAGLQVHRSWWIAVDEVVQITREGRRTISVMSDGTRVPVSETYRAVLKERIGGLAGGG